MTQEVKIKISIKDLIEHLRPALKAQGFDMDSWELRNEEGNKRLGHGEIRSTAVVNDVADDYVIAIVAGKDTYSGSPNTILDAALGDVGRNITLKL